MPHISNQVQSSLEHDMLLQRLSATIPCRVELHPATDDWMRGDRYGLVKKKLSFNNYQIFLDKSRKHKIISGDNIYKII